MSHSILSALIHQLSDFPDAHIAIAYSGGIDSQVLLHACMHLITTKKITNSVTVCHIHHGLSPQANEWQSFAKQQCDTYQLNFLTENIRLDSCNNTNIEAQARDARYQALKNMTNKQDVILTGHHLNDQAETFLLALKRGAGVKGLSAMASVRDFSGRYLIRPLLNISRKEIEAYAEQHQLTWVEDSSNTDTRFDRNFLRQQVLPLLQKRWPAIDKTIVRSAQHLMEAEELLDELAEQDLANVAKGVELTIAPLLTLSLARLKNALRKFLINNDCLPPSQQQLQQIVKQLSVAEDKTPEINIAQHCLRRYQGKLILTPQYQDISDWQYHFNMEYFVNSRVTSDQTKQINEEKERVINVSLPDELGTLSFTADHSSQRVTENEQLICVPIDAEISIKFQHNNPKCLPAYRQHHRSLKKVLQELTIAPWLRTRQPFLSVEQHFAALIGHFVCLPYTVNQPSTQPLMYLKVSYQQNKS